MKRRRISPTTITTGIASDAPWHTNTARRRGCGYFIWSACTQEVLPDRLRRAVQMSAKPKNRDRDLPMDLQETRGDVQVAHRPARGAGTLSRGFGFFMMASERRDSRSRFHRNLYGDTPSSVVRAKIISNFVTADVRKDCGGHTGSVFARLSKKMWQFSIAKGNEQHSFLFRSWQRILCARYPISIKWGYCIVYFAMGSPQPSLR